MKKLLTTLAAATLMVLSANAARADIYIGGSLGVTSMSPTVAEDSVSDWNYFEYGAGNDCDALGCTSDEETSGGLKFFAGYRVNSYFAVEGFAAYLGTFDSYANDNFGVDSFASAEVKTLGVAAVGMFPLGSGKVSLLGKLGAHSWSAEGSIDLWDTVAVDGYAGSYKVSGNDFMGGLGVEINFTERAAMRVELEYFEASTNYTDFGIGLLSVGGMFRF